MWSPFAIFLAVFPRKSMGKTAGEVTRTPSGFWGLGRNGPCQNPFAAWGVCRQTPETKGNGGWLLKALHAKILLGFKGGPFSPNLCRTMQHMSSDLGRPAAKTLQIIMPKFCWDFWMDLFQTAFFENKAEFLQQAVLWQEKSSLLEGYNSI